MSISLANPGRASTSQHTSFTNVGSKLLTDMNNYKPLQIMNLGDLGMTILAVTDEVYEETMLIVRFYNKVCVYSIKKKVGDDNGFPDSDQLFDVTKLQECSLTQQTTQAITISPISTSSLPQKRLSYAFSLLQQDTIFVVKQEGKELNTEVNILHDYHIVTTLKGQGAAVTHLAFDQEEGQLLAALSDDKTCSVWDVDQRVSIVTFPLRSPGSAVSWHKSQRYKLMVAERDGWIKFFNVAKQVCVQSINVFRAPLLCADWSPNDCLHVALGSLGSGLLIDTSVLNTQNTKIIDTMSDSVNAIQYSRGDTRMIATIGKTQGELKLWQQGITRHVWSQRKEKIQAFTWLPEKPYIIALAGNNLMIFEAAPF